MQPDYHNIHLSYGTTHTIYLQRRESTVCLSHSKRRMGNTRSMGKGHALQGGKGDFDQIGIDRLVLKTVVWCWQLGQLYLLMEKYEIIDVIDEGAYGIVWKALNKETNGLIAIKEFKESDEDEFSRRTIQRQIKMLKMLKGDYVVNIKQAFKKKGKVYLIFEHFSQNLLNLIQKFQNGLDPQLINTLVYKIIKCLQYLHSKNIVHRDVKPENLLLNSDYSVLKICDFGFARFMPEKQYDLTDYVATRWYRSPELLVGEPYGKAADMWAVGCMIGQLVDGQPMFPGDDQVDQIYQINKLVGNLTSVQKDYFSRNSKFQNMELAQVRRGETIDMRYLGKIERNALSFMKVCLRMNPAERMTIEQALRHPFLLELSQQEDESASDEQNLLQVPRKAHIKNESKASLVSVKDNEDYKNTKDNKDSKDSKDSKAEQEEVPYVQPKAKLSNNSIPMKKGLKLEGGSMNDRDTHMPSINYDAEVMSSVHKKKSHTNLQTMKLDEHPDKPKHKKLQKIMSEEKNLKLNFDVNVKINLKINQRSVEKRELREQIESKIENKLKGVTKNRLLPQINGNKGTRYHLNVRHQKPNQLISIKGETKQLTRGSKPNLHHY